MIVFTFTLKTKSREIARLNFSGQGQGQGQGLENALHVYLVPDIVYVGLLIPRSRWRNRSSGPEMGFKKMWGLLRLAEEDRKLRRKRSSVVIVSMPV